MQGGGRDQALSGGFQARSGTLLGLSVPGSGPSYPSRPKMTLKMVMRAYGKGGP